MSPEGTTIRSHATEPPPAYSSVPRDARLRRRSHSPLDEPMLTYNTLIVLLGTGLLGANAGLVGSFAVLRGVP